MYIFRINSSITPYSQPRGVLVYQYGIHRQSLTSYVISRLSVTYTSGECTAYRTDVLNIVWLLKSPRNQLVIECTLCHCLINLMSLQHCTSSLDSITISSCSTVPLENVRRSVIVCHINRKDTGYFLKTCTCIMKNSFFAPRGSH